MPPGDNFSIRHDCARRPPAAKVTLCGIIVLEDIVMKLLKLEIEVVLFLVIGILCMGYITIKLGKLDILSGNYYNVSAQFDSVVGLKAGDRVEIAGVDVGKVDRIVLDPTSDNQAQVYLKIEKGVKITDDVIASIRTSGIIGDKFISLSQGASEHMISNNGTIQETESSVDILALVSKYLNSKGK